MPIIKEKIYLDYINITKEKILITLTKILIKTISKALEFVIRHIKTILLIIIQLNNVILPIQKLLNN